MRRSRLIRVLVMLNHTLKAARDEISGILRLSSLHPDIEVRVFDRNITPSTLCKRISDWIPDGIITDNRGAVPTLLPGKRPNCITFQIGRTRDIPVVYIDFLNPTASSVDIDDREIGECAANFFLSRKYENFAFVGTNLAHTENHSRARFDSFENTVLVKGFRCEKFIFDEKRPHSWATELARLEDWIVKLPKPCALLAHADAYAQLVTDVCRLAKISIPEQIALIGVDNEIDIADNLRPTLSSILPDFENAGVLAFETLMKLMSKRCTPRRPIRITYGVKALIERASTQDTHGARRLVDAARGIIRKKSHEGIRISDVARLLNVSNRLLELHFQNVLGHSVRDELLNYRLEEVRHRLLETDEPIESLALQCGWRSSIALKLLFKKRFKMTMRDFRKNPTRTPSVTFSHRRQLWRSAKSM